VAFSPDGRQLAAGSFDSTVKIWDATTGKEIHTLHGLAGYVWSVAFSPDGKRLAASSGYAGKGEIKIWDTALWEKPAEKGH
jgi:WD40 repeat protein